LAPPVPTPRLRSIARREFGPAGARRAQAERRRRGLIGTGLIRKSPAFGTMSADERGASPSGGGIACLL